LKFGLHLAALACAVVLVHGQQPAAGEIVLGMSAAFTGSSGQLGSELYRGAQAYFEEVNSKGGVSGQRIRVRALDDAYDPVRTIRNTIQLIDTDRVSLLFGYVGTPTVTRVLPLIRRYGAQSPYLLFPFTGAQPQRTPPYNEYVYNLRASYLEETAGLVDNFVRVGATRVAIFYQADAYGRSGWDGVRGALGRHGLKIVAEATYRRGTPYTDSMKAQVDVLRAAQPDVVISIGAYAACAAFIRDAVNAGWTVPIANVSFVGSESMLELLQAEGRATGRDYSTVMVNSQVVPSYEDQSLPAVREYRALLEKWRPRLPDGLADPEGERVRFNFVSFEGFLDAKLAVEAIGRAEGEVDRISLQQAFSTIDHYDLGIDGEVSFALGRTQGLNQVYYTRVEQGRFVPVDDWKRWSKK
jgi:ABC-type branched-subunit amino acid transport system substrate-binding protein